MDWGKWKVPVLGWVGLAFAVWLIAYSINWNVRYGQEQFWGDALFGAFGDAVLLGWVKDYQTLIGGLAAIGGAWVIYANSRRERTNVVSDRQDALREERLAAISRLRLAVLHLDSRLIGPNIELEHIRADVAQVGLAASAVAPFANRLATWASMTSRFIESQFAVIVLLEAGEEQTNRLARLKDAAALATEFLRKPERFIAPDGTFLWVKAPRPEEIDPDKVPMMRDSFEDL